MTRPNNDLIAWCRAHPWGRNAALSATGQVVEGLVDPNTGVEVRKPARYSVLRRWAGYEPVKPLLK